MKILSKILFIIFFGLTASGCTIRHFVAADYPQYLNNNIGGSQLPKAKLETDYSMTPATESNQYEFRSFMSGYANLWIVEFGKILDQTLQSKDVQDAFGRLSKRSAGDDKSGKNLLFELIQYTFTDSGAHIELKISVQKDGAELLTRNYKADGETQGGKVFWGGVFAMKNAIQQSTKGAIDMILKNLISDLNREGFNQKTQ